MSTHSTTAGNIVHNRFRRAPLSRFSLAPLARAWAAFRGWNNRRIAIRELNAMPDALLRDIGIERYQIPDAVKHSNYPEILRLRQPKAAPTLEVKKAA